MLRKLFSLIVCLGLILTAQAVISQDAPAEAAPTGPPGAVTLEISGPGAVNSTTIKAGEKVSFDFYFTNDKVRRGLSVGFKITSDDIAQVIHVPDSGNGLNPNGDCKGYNGWQDRSVFDLTGIMCSMNDWDGNLPDTGLHVGIVIKKSYQPHAKIKGISWDIIVPEAGTLVIDSCFSPPGGDWMFDNNEKPGWGGPYTFKVVK